MIKRILPILLTLPMLANDSLTQNQKQEVRALIAETIKQQPKLVIEAIMNFRKNQMLAYQKQAESNINKFSKEIYDQNNLLVLGNPNGKTIIIEFIDYNCSHCKKLSTTLKSLAQENKDLKVIVKDLPIFGESSTIAAKAALAAYKQNKYAEFHYAALTSKKPYNLENMQAIAQELGLNIDKFNADFNSEFTNRYIENNKNLAKKLKISATPAMIIGSKDKHNFFAGSMPKAQLKEAIADLK